MQCVDSCNEYKDLVDLEKTKIALVLHSIKLYQIDKQSGVGMHNKC